jgi:acyl carrier protein
MSDVASRLETIFSELFWSESVEVRSLTRMGSTNWDSLAHLNLLMAVEQEFKVSLDDEEVAQLNSFEVVLGIVESKLGNVADV